MEHPGRPRRRDHLPVRGPQADRGHPGQRGPAGAPPAQRHVLQLVRPGDRDQADHLAGERQPGVPVPVLGRQRLDGRRPADGQQRRPPAPRPGPRPAGPDGLRLLLRPGGRAAAGRVLGRPAGQRVHHPRQLPRPHRPAGALHLPPLRQPEHRAAHRQLPRHRLRPGPGQPLLPDGPHLPADLRLGLAGAAAGRGHPHLPGRRGVRGPLPLPRHGHRAQLGREHVRGPDGAAAGARGPLGAAELGREPPAVRPRPDRARPRGGRLRATGASRPPTTPPAATASTGSTPSASTPTATPPTTSTPWSTTASATAGRPSRCRPPRPTPTGS